MEQGSARGLLSCLNQHSELFSDFVLSGGHFWFRRGQNKLVWICVILPRKQDYFWNPKGKCSSKTVCATLYFLYGLYGLSLMVSPSYVTYCSLVGHSYKTEPQSLLCGQYSLDNCTMCIGQHNTIQNKLDTTLYTTQHKVTWTHCAVHKAFPSVACRSDFS